MSRRHRYRCDTSAAAGQKTVGDVLGAGGGVALRGVAPATATTGFQHQPVAGPDNDAGLLGLERARLGIAGVQRVAVRPPALAAKDAAGAVPPPLPRSVPHSRFSGLDDDLDDAAGTAAKLAGAARIRPK